MRWELQSLRESMMVENENLEGITKTLNRFDEQLSNLKSHILSKFS
jgi:hypothetical protein